MCLVSAAGPLGRSGGQARKTKKVTLTAIWNIVPDRFLSTRKDCSQDFYGVHTGQHHMLYCVAPNDVCKQMVDAPGLQGLYRVPKTYVLLLLPVVLAWSCLRCWRGAGVVLTWC